ncbi:MAG: hypothetical protein WAV72_19195, partial [Bradyrhizobium sp.]
MKRFFDLLPTGLVLDHGSTGSIQDQNRACRADDESCCLYGMGSKYCGSAPDPTEKLVGKMREFVEGNGTKFLVGIQHHDEALVRYLE